MRVLAYGEDSLSFWAIQNRLEYILSETNCSLENSLSIYRPSFGRGGSRKKAIGEFDILILTKEKILLIESKWWRSKEFKKRTGVIEIHENQIKRHAMLRAVIVEYGFMRLNMEYTYEGTEAKLKWIFDKNVPRKGDILLDNLKFILDKVRIYYNNYENGVPKFQNVLLYFYRDDKPVPNKCSLVNYTDYVKISEERDLQYFCGDFQIVNIDYTGCHENDFVIIDFC